MRRVPGVPSPLAQTLPSGLSRTEQLLIVQRHLDLPFVPSYVARHGGWVVDRVLHTLGSRGTRWWTTVTARLRAQQALLQQMNGRKNVLLDPDNYSLSCKARANLGLLGALAGVAELDSLQQLRALIKGEELPTPPQVRATLKKSVRAVDVSAEVALHTQYLDNVGAYKEVPRVISLDVGSSRRNDSLRYRAGVYQTINKAHAEADVEAGAAEGPMLERSEFAQAAVSLEGEVDLWKARRAAAAGAGAPALPPVHQGPFAWESDEEEAKPKPLKRLRRPINALLSKPKVSLAGVVGGLVQAPLRPIQRFHESETYDFPTRPPLNTLEEALRESKKRLFASCCLNVQLGSFSRQLFDYTGVSLRVDAGLPVLGYNAVSRAGPISRSDSSNHLARVPSQVPKCIFAQATSSYDSTLSVSLSQQLVGPLRARVDTTYDVSVNPKHQSLAAVRKAPLAVARDSVKPLETVYGLDMTVPGSSGAARFVVWYAPTRKEGMGEVRLL